MDPVFLLAQRVLTRRAALQEATARGYEDALAGLGPLREGPLLTARIPPGMLEALCIAAEAGRASESLDAHYTRVMPAQLALQLRSRGGPEERLFSARLELSRMPRLRGALESLFDRVAAAGLPCAETLGAATPAALLRARPTLAALYAGCHFGSSMPMLYAYPGDLAEAALRGRAPEDQVEARYVGPLIHELAHLQPLDPELVPAPANLHEALAAWLGALAFPPQLRPAPETATQPRGGEDALPGGAFFAAVGAWVARAVGERNAIRAQAGALDLRDAPAAGSLADEASATDGSGDGDGDGSGAGADGARAGPDDARAGGLGAPCAEALRLFGWLPFLETSAPHLLADAFHPARWWKLVDLHRDPALRARFQQACVQPLLEAGPPVGLRLEARWCAALDALDWPDLPAWRDAPGPHDAALARLACGALSVRTVREGPTFRARQEPPPPWPRGQGPTGEVLGKGPLRLDVRACLLRAAWDRPDAVCAPAEFPYPPAHCAAWDRVGYAEVRGGPDGLPPLPI